MNVLQLVQRIGGVAICDIEHGELLLALINDALPSTIHVDIQMTGDDLMASYKAWDIEVKKKIAQIKFDDPAKLLRMLNDISYIETQRKAIQQTEQRARYFQLVIILSIVCIIDTWYVYSYHTKAKEVLGDQYKSTVIEFFDKVGELFSEPKDVTEVKK